MGKLELELGRKIIRLLKGVLSSISDYLDAKEKVLK